MSEEQKKVNTDEIEGEENDIVELEDEDGNVVPFSWVGTFEYENDTYVVFEPAEPNEDFEEGEAVIFQLDTDSEGNDLFLPIESEEKLQAVFNEFLKLYEAENCECDGECDCKGEATCSCDHEHKDGSCCKH